ncbi:MAG: hypothetical protein K2G13_06595, partial [Muribaculaceae bacterium]|nr:hypothetical protein [Muribaculaceae bacterium]
LTAQFLLDYLSYEYWLVFLLLVGILIHINCIFSCQPAIIPLVCLYRWIHFGGSLAVGQKYCTPDAIDIFI